MCFVDCAISVRGIKRSLGGGMTSSEQHPDREHTDGQAGGEAVQDDLEPDRDDAERVSGGRDPASGLPTGKRMHMP